MWIEPQINLISCARLKSSLYKNQYQNQCPANPGLNYIVAGEALLSGLRR